MLRKFVVVTASLGAISGVAGIPVAVPEAAPKAIAGYDTTPPAPPAYWNPKPPKDHRKDSPHRGRSRSRSRSQSRGRSPGHHSYESPKGYSVKHDNPAPSPHRPKSRGRSRSRSHSKSKSPTRSKSRGHSKSKSPTRSHSPGGPPGEYNPQPYRTKRYKRGQSSHRSESPGHRSKSRSRSRSRHCDRSPTDYKSY